MDLSEFKSLGKEQQKVAYLEIKERQTAFKAKMIFRCESDVRINMKLWKKMLWLLDLLYVQNPIDRERYIEYLSFKMDCVREQEQIGIKIDVLHCEEVLATLTKEKEVKVDQLASAMPQCAIKSRKTYKDAIEDKNGNLFQKGDLFFNSVGQDRNAKEIIREKTIGWKAPNPNSSSQIKNWLFSLGWIPVHIKNVKNKESGEVKKVPQTVSVEGRGELCPSVIKLFPKEPNLKMLESLGVISHRIGIFKALLKQRVEDRVFPSCSGLTNTLRLQHSVVVNLPGVDKLYGHEVRASLIADEGKLLCGSDLSGIEDNTKRHYIYQYDPEYVEEMNRPGYDAHLDIAVLANFVTSEDVAFYKTFNKKKKEDYTPTKEETNRFEKLHLLRARAKMVNFSATYGVGAKTLSLNANISIKEAEKLLKVYWDRNEAITKVERSLKVKEIYNQKWLLNPISKFWYTLRAEKDRFSTLNQGTAVFVFDTWLKYIREQDIKVIFQMHDEVVFNTEDKEKTKLNINSAMKEVNEKLKLNIKVACSIDFGKSYAEVH